MTQNNIVEEKLAHLQRVVDDLSDTVATQDKTIAVLERKVALLLHREAERESSLTDGAVFTDERPPHY
ncbi:MAG: SlyX family protein [Paracoccaceae bacterium]